MEKIKTILISGAGVAGPTLAYWLRNYGFEPTLVEHSPQLRTGGYVVDFWGVGYDVAERMGLIPELNRVAYHVEEVRMVDRRNRRVGGFKADVFARLTHNRFFSLARGDLAASLYRSLRGEVETLFADEITALEQNPQEVRVHFRNAPVREFDLVIGADGLHSCVRRLAFGDQSKFERFLGYQVAAFEAKGYQPRDEDVYMMYTEVGRQVGRFTLSGDRTLFIFIFRCEHGNVPREPEARRAVLRQLYGGDGWELAGILGALEDAPDLYFDRVSQIHMDSWANGRVTLVGDAASCVSLMAGEGSGLAMAAAYILAGELAGCGGRYGDAFSRYQSLFKPFVATKQKAALTFGGYFAPESALGLFLRNQLSKLLNCPLLAALMLGREFRDELQLPDYQNGKPGAPGYKEEQRDSF